jgi:hypothetical protein
MLIKSPISSNLQDSHQIFLAQKLKVRKFNQELHLDHLHLYQLKGKYQKVVANQVAVREVLAEKE